MVGDFGKTIYGWLIGKGAIGNEGTLRLPDGSAQDGEAGTQDMLKREGG